jgi:hypothetical protein
VSFAGRLGAVDFVFLVCGFLVWSILFPPKKKPKSTAHQFGEAFEKLLKESFAAGAKKD